MSTRLYHYDVEEESIMGRMIRELVEKDGWDVTDFEEMSFLDIEAEYLDVFPDFRSSQ